MTERDNLRQSELDYQAQLTFEKKEAHEAGTLLPTYRGGKNREEACFSRLQVYSARIVRGKNFTYF